MSVVTYEGIVEDGRIRLEPAVRLPDKTKVYVVVPGMPVQSADHIFSPRLAHSEEQADFVMEMVDEPSDVGV
jgi:hypothetical protein